MSSIFGKNIQVSIFGQSHSEAIGVTVHGLPPGFAINFDALQTFLDRRAPGQTKYSTTRKEGDVPRFISGLNDRGLTCGAPLTAIIENTDVRSKDYATMADIPRPGHADYPGHVKYKGFEDIRGGGHFSGRLTAPLCVAGGVALQMLKQKGIGINATILSVYGNSEDPISEILIAKKQADSVGGLVHCEITGVPAGLGAPMFDAMESKLSQVIFGIPAIRGIEFGTGFAAASMRGSEHNDPFYLDEDGSVKTRTNHHGGILGGITSGMPITFNVAVKPTSSIGLKQNSFSYTRQENAPLIVKGRHDPCIVPRVLPCIESAAALVLLDFML